VLAAQRNWTTAPLPDRLVTGEGPTSAAAWGRSQGPVQDRSDLGQDLGQVDLADAR
jgi:hypothetical protein